MVHIDKTGKENEIWLPKPYDVAIACHDSAETWNDGYTTGYADGFAQGVSDAEEECHPDYSKIPLTFEILSAGTVMFIGNNEELTGFTIEYSINDGPWTELVSSFEGATVSVNPGDIVRFRGNNETYGIDNYHNKLICTGEHKIYGNIMSLINSTDFESLDTVGFHTFDSFFRGQEGYGPDNKVVDASNLILPATAVGDSSYSELFSDCRLLVKGPTLVAPVLARACYWAMFNGCGKLEYVKCLATDISAANCTEAWLGWVHSTGIFVKAAGMNHWPTGDSGIPNGWTVEDAE